MAGTDVAQTGVIPVQTSNGQFMGGNAAIPMPPEYGVPMTPATMPANDGSAGHVNKGTALASGLDAGANFAGKVIANYRGRQQYNQDQAARQKNADSIASSTNSQPTPEQHQSFMASLGASLAHAGSAIHGFFSPGGQPQGIPAPAAAPAPPAAAAPPPAPAPAPAPAPPQAPAAMMQGGPVPPRQPSHLPFAPHAPVPGFAKGGAVPNTKVPEVPFPHRVSGTHFVPIPGLANGGPMPGRPGTGPAAFIPTPGLADGGPMPNAAPQPAPQAAPAAPAAQAVPNPQQQAAAAPVAAAMDDFHQHLLDGALNDKGEPNGKAGVPPAPTPQAAMAQAQNNKASQAGVPEDQPKGAHSLSPEYWDQSDQKMAQAAQAAALAGHDPNQVMQALTNVRTSFIQSHMLRALQGANAALLNGDDKSVEQNLRNLNYYLPNGQDLSIKKDANGKLIYQDPIQPYVDDKGNPVAEGAPGAKPNLVPVDAAHIHMLGVNALDPMNVQNAILAARSAVSEQRLRAQEGTAKVLAAQGTEERGRGVLAEGEAKLKEVAATNVNKLSQAQWYQSRAAMDGYAMQRWKASMGQRIDPSTLKGAQGAASAVDDVLLGKKTAVPTTDQEGNPSLSPAAGKVVHDPGSVPKEFANVNPLEAGEIRATAGDLYIAQGGRMSPQQAAQTALQMHSAKGKFHKGADGSQQPDAYIHRETGEAGIYDKSSGKYIRFHIPPQSAAAMLDGGGKMPEDAFLKSYLGANNASPGAIPSQGDGQSLDQKYPEENNGGDGSSS